MKKLLTILLSTVFAGTLAGGITLATGCNREPDVSGLDNKGSWTVSSPDGTVTSDIVMDYAGNLSYTVKKENVTVVEKSALGMTIAEDDFRLLTVEKQDGKKVSGSYENITGKHSKVDYECNETTITFKGWSFYLDVIMRAYDDGYAFRYNVRAIDGGDGVITVLEENTQFALPEDTTLWTQPYSGITTGINDGNYFAYEGSYDKKKSDDLSGEYISMPMLYKVKGTGYYSLITESDLIGSGFYGSFLKEDDADEGSGILQTVPTPAGYMLDDNKIGYPFESPWRVGIVGDMATVQESELVEKVYDDAEYWRPDNYDSLSAEEKKTYDYEWVEPGVTAWSWLIYLNDATQSDFGLHRRYVDVAVEMGWKYVILDGGWNSGLDVNSFKSFVKEANDKGIKIIVWCNALTDFSYGRPETLSKKLDLWKSWGVSGIKIDFFDGQNALAPQFYGEDTGTIDWYEKIYQECAKREMIVNCHGANKPTGERRIYPNVVNREAIRGNENKTIDASVTINQLFIRGVIGPSDWTPVVNPFNSGMTMAHQMALAILFENGTPSMADREYTYQNSLIKEFYKNIPALHDDTKFLSGELDGYYVGAVRAGSQWFVGGVNSVVKTTAKVDFSFLEDGVTYEAEIFENHGTDNKKVNRRKINITKGDIEFFDMVKNGGFAVRLTPKN